MGQARSFLTLGGSFFGNQRIVSWVGLCGIGPALAGNVGTGGAFALSREGNQGVDVPMLAPALSRCRPGVLFEIGVSHTYLHKRGHSLLY